MIKHNLPFVESSSNMQDIIVKMTEGRLGLALCRELQKSFMWIITDGDLRRSLVKNVDLSHIQPKDVMNDSTFSVALLESD